MSVLPERDVTPARLGWRHSDLNVLWWLEIPRKLGKSVFKDDLAPERVWQVGIQGGGELQRVLDRADGNRQRAEQRFWVRRSAK